MSTPVDYQPDPGRRLGVGGAAVQLRVRGDPQQLDKGRDYETPFARAERGLIV